MRRVGRKFCSGPNIPVIDMRLKYISVTVLAALSCAAPIYGKERTNEEISQLTAAFTRLDNNRDDLISAAELVPMYSNFNNRVGVDAMQPIMMKADLNGDGSMNRQEFTDYFARDYKNR